MVTCTKKDGRAMVVLEDGSEMSRKAYILKRYSEDDMKRGDIAKELGVPVQVVFAFTRNIENSHHKPGVGRAAAEDVLNPETGEVAPRVQVIRDMAAAGKTRKEIAVALGISYQAVYMATKPAKAKAEVEAKAEAPVEAKAGEVEAPVEAEVAAEEEAPRRKKHGLF